MPSKSKKYCCMPSCGIWSNNCSKDITFHSIPTGKKDAEWRAEVIRIVNRDDEWFNPAYAVICSQHYAPESFSIGTTGKKRLIPGSLPTLESPARPNAKPRFTKPKPEYHKKREKKTKAPQSKSNKVRDATSYVDIENEKEATYDNFSLNVEKLDIEKIQSLRNIIMEVAWINLDVLSVCLEGEKHEQARLELDKLRRLVETIRSELKLDLKTGPKEDNPRPVRSSSRASAKKINFKTIDDIDSDTDDCSLMAVDKTESKMDTSVPSPQDQAEDCEDLKESLVLPVTFLQDEPSTSTSTENKGTDSTTVDDVLKNMPRRNGEPETSSNELIGQKIGSPNSKGDSNSKEIEIPDPDCFCERCGKVYASAASCRAHMRWHNDKDLNLKFSCEICGKQCPSRNAKVKHKTKDHNSIIKKIRKSEFKSNSCVCETCGKVFKTPKRLRIHKKWHMDIDSNLELICDVCGKIYTSNMAMSKHKKSHLFDWQCTLCKKHFTEKQGLTAHMRIHNGEKPFTCCYCGMAFNRSNNRRRHEYAHQYNKLHKCQHCEKSFTQPDHLKAHMRHHTGERIKCSLCEKTFLENGSLRKHMRHHTGERLKCPFCEKLYMDNYGLRLHKKKVHGILPIRRNIIQKVPLELLVPFETSEPSEPTEPSVKHELLLVPIEAIEGIDNIPI